MGCDGFIPNPKTPARLDMTCYTCRDWIDPKDPLKGHENCTDDDERLRVIFDTENYNER